MVMNSSVIKRSVVLAGHKTSVSLEDPFWNALREIAKRRGTTLSALIESIDHDRQHTNLSSAIRMFVLAAYQHQIAPPQNERVVEDRALLAN